MLPIPGTARLVRPTIALVAGYLDALREADSSPTFWSEDLPLATVEADPCAHVRSLREQEGTQGSFEHLWLVSEGVFIGRVGIRFELNDRQRHSVGHIGYAIRPSYRRRGFGRRALVLAKEHAWTKGLRRVLLVCADDNLGSVRIIESCGGVLEDVRRHPDFSEILMRRYWIDLRPSSRR
jgi:predicted acetyltransferase